jgi:hypothetical protein
VHSQRDEVPVVSVKGWMSDQLRRNPQQADCAEHQQRQAYRGVVDTMEQYREGQRAKDHTSYSPSCICQRCSSMTTKPDGCQQGDVAACRDAADSVAYDFVEKRGQGRCQHAGGSNRGHVVALWRIRVG